MNKALLKVIVVLMAVTILVVPTLTWAQNDTIVNAASGGQGGQIGWITIGIAGVATVGAIVFIGLAATMSSQDSVVTTAIHHNP